MKKSEDHYVAQTYLKWFNNHNNKLLVYNKQYCSVKEKTAAQICKEPNGSNNPFLSKERAIEDCLKYVENNWNEVIKVFISGNINFESYLNAKHIISLYMAYLRTSTPAAVRVKQKELEAHLKTTFKLLVKSGKIADAPESYKPITDDIENNGKFDIDPKFPKAISAGIMESAANSFFKSAWLRIENHSNIPFITSDNPICFWYSHILSQDPFTYLPLTPKISILVKPFLNKKDVKYYNHSEDNSAIARPEFVATLNEQVIKHAEKIVIANQKSDTILEEVKKFCNWQYDCVINKVPHEKGEVIITKAVVSEKDSARKSLVISC